MAVNLNIYWKKLINMICKTDKQKNCTSIYKAWTNKSNVVFSGVCKLYVYTVWEVLRVYVWFLGQGHITSLQGH